MEFRLSAACREKHRRFNRRGEKTAGFRRRHPADDQKLNGGSWKGKGVRISCGCNRENKFSLSAKLADARPDTFARR